MPKIRLSRLAVVMGVMLIAAALTCGCTTTNPSYTLAEAGVTRNADWTPYTEVISGAEMALVPAGCFQMGSADGDQNERPVHEVCFEEPFWIDVYEATNEAFGSVSPDCTQWSSDNNQPHACVNWTDALAYCEARGARLPTEAEWEYAARGPDGLAFPWGNTFDGTLTNYCDASCERDWADAGADDGYPYTAPVGSYPGGVSWVGAYDMAGNEWEWVNDWMSFTYYGSLEDGTVNPQGPSDGQERVIRGGSWNDPLFALQSTVRDFAAPSDELGDFGIRCARDY